MDMSGTHTYVERLTDAELYQELIKHGFPAGPVVATTRKLYQRRLCHILEGGHGGEQELLTHTDEVEEQLTQPGRVDGDIGGTKWSHKIKSESVRPRTGVLEPHSSYGSDVAAGKSSLFQSATYCMSSREQEKDDTRIHSPLSSAYLDTVRGVGNYEADSKPSPSWLLDSSATQPNTSSSWRTYGSSGNESFLKSRHRTTILDTSAAARQEMASRYRLSGCLDDKTSVLSRHNPERQRSKSVRLNIRLTVFIILVLVAIAFCYVVYNAWHENDPYQQIEQDVAKFIEERKLLDK